MLQLACAWDLAHDPVACVAPTLIQEAGPAARAGRGQARRARGAAARAAAERRGGRAASARSATTRGCMALKGAVPDHEGDDLPDRWSLRDEHLAIAERWRIDPARDLVADATERAAAHTRSAA